MIKKKWPRMIVKSRIIGSDEVVDLAVPARRDEKPTQQTGILGVADHLAGLPGQQPGQPMLLSGAYLPWRSWSSSWLFVSGELQGNRKRSTTDQ